MSVRSSPVVATDGLDQRRHKNDRMPVENLKDALSAAWRVRARCIDGRIDNGRSVGKCRYQAELNVETLVWTRGRNMLLTDLSARMMCPRCGNRRVSLILEPPPVAGRAAE